MPLPARTFLARLMLAGALLGLWEAATVTGLADPFFVSSPSAVGAELWRMLHEATFYNHLWMTLKETLAGFALGAMLGLGAALWLALTPFWSKVLDPFLMVLYGMPRVAFAPLFVMWFGLGALSKIVFALSLVFFVVFYSCHAGLRALDASLVNSVRVMGASRRQILVHVVLPSLAPWVASSLKSAAGLALLGAVLGEYVGSTAGLGWVINTSAGLFQTSRVFAALAALAVVVLVMHALLGRLERWLTRWRVGSHAL
ncbi:ABC transporter permease [Fundidesulfovibrio putealis]|uniref:ABC transporter permease n=1 Tax=Fundidesulfovibrio putealis TaxID=270496 RepID=UPI00041942CE|nr:ABC transporter permease [Fundidesulfovibrio putealis]